MKMRFAAIAVLAAAALVGACDDEDTRTITDVVTVTVRDTIRIGNTTTTVRPDRAPRQPAGERGDGGEAGARPLQQHHPSQMRPSSATIW
jgi:hypothetical protein